MSRFGPGWINQLKAWLGPPTWRVFNRSVLIVDKAAEHESRFQALSEGELRKAGLDLRWRAKGGEPLPKLVPEVFALVREAAQRTIGLRHHDVQLLAGMAMTQRCVIEMEAGEGKTLVATLTASLMALTGKGVHVMTVNDYLAQRDADLMAPVYNTIGLTVGCIQTEMDRPRRRDAYACDITYGTATQFGFDFLHDRLAADSAGVGSHQAAAMLFGEVGKSDPPVQREHYCALVDEADSVLIDEARTPLIISAPAPPPEAQVVSTYDWSAKHAPDFVEEEHYTRDRVKHKYELTRDGRQRIRGLEMPAGVDRIPLEELYEYVERAIKIHHEFFRDQQYVVVDDEVKLVDESTGRIMEGRKLRAGNHQAIEAKEGVPVTAATNQAARTTIQNFFLRYKELMGMTGTIWSARSETRRIYKLRSLRIPTHHPLKRSPGGDRVFATADERWNAVVEEAESLHKQGRPVLIGTRSIDKSELLSERLKAAGVPHTVLNAKLHAQEAEVVAKAGEEGVVTIATNMAGRGTDILITEGVIAMGGLHVIGTERHESKRVDKQLVGRSGRHGSPGSSQFFLSFEDELLEGFGPKKAAKLKRVFSNAETSGGLDHLWRLFRRAQHKTEKKQSRDRSMLMRYEKRRNEMQTNMGLDPFLDAAEQ